MDRWFKKGSDGPLLAILMISLTAIITHGLNIPRLGYYHDDWYMLWSGASRGAGSMLSLFSTDRPFMGMIYTRTYILFRDNLLGWHLAALFTRIVGGVVFYWILRLAWPKLKNYFVLAAMLFVVYPGFLAQPHAATKINHLLGYGAALFSIALTLQAAKTSHKGLKTACYGLSILSLAFYLWIYEYMLGLEIMRIALLFWILWQGAGGKVSAVAKRVFLTYIPNILVIGSFLYWRLFIFVGTRKTTDVSGLFTDYLAHPAAMVFRLLFQEIKDFFSASLFAWFVQPYHLLVSADFGGILTASLTACAVALLAVWTIRAARQSENPESDNGAPGAVVIGALIILAAVFPVVLSNRHLDLMDAYKAYALHPSAGVLILLLGLVAMIKPYYRKTVLLALLVLSVGTQSLNAQRWANLWEVQRNFWWQLSWRAPMIRDNTVVMAVSPVGYGFQQDHEIWGPLNLIYHPEQRIDPLLHSEVLDPSTALDVILGTVEPDLYVRDVFMPRDYHNFLLVSQPSLASCVYVIDGMLPAYAANERLLIQEVGSYSNLALIDASAEPALPPTAIFGPEPTRGWCYYYEQASLARQMGDWQRISDLYGQTQSLGLKPGDPSEYFVFIEGLVNSGRVDSAKEVVSGEIGEDAALKYSLCKSLASAPPYPDSFGYQLDLINQLVCP